MLVQNAQDLANYVIWVLDYLSTNVIRVQLPILPTNNKMNTFTYINRLQVKSYRYNRSDKRNKKQLTCGKGTNELLSVDR